jgi:hypothetical protein
MRCWGRLLREYFSAVWLVTDADVDFRYCAVLVVFMGNMPD